MVEKFEPIKIFKQVPKVNKFLSNTYLVVFVQKNGTYKILFIYNTK